MPAGKQIEHTKSNLPTKFVDAHTIVIIIRIQNESEREREKAI